MIWDKISFLVVIIESKMHINAYKCQNKYIYVYIFILAFILLELYYLKKVKN